MPTMTFASPTISSSDSSWCGYSGNPRSVAQRAKPSNSASGVGLGPAAARAGALSSGGSVGHRPAAAQAGHRRAVAGRARTRPPAWHARRTCRTRTRTTSWRRAEHPCRVRRTEWLRTGTLPGEGVGRRPTAAAERAAPAGRWVIPDPALVRARERGDRRGRAAARADRRTRHATTVAESVDRTGRRRSALARRARRAGVVGTDRRARRRPRRSCSTSRRSRCLTVALTATAGRPRRRASGRDALAARAGLGRGAVDHVRRRHRRHLPGAAQRQSRLDVEPARARRSCPPLALLEWLLVGPTRGRQPWWTPLTWLVVPVGVPRGLLQRPQPLRRAALPVPRSGRRELLALGARSCSRSSW